MRLLTILIGGTNIMILSMIYRTLIDKWLTSTSRWEAFEAASNKMRCSYDR